MIIQRRNGHRNNRGGEIDFGCLMSGDLLDYTPKGRLMSVLGFGAIASDDQWRSRRRSMVSNDGRWQVGGPWDVLHETQGNENNEG
jgi:hypothetical protein